MFEAFDKIHCLNITIGIKKGSIISTSSGSTSPEAITSQGSLQKGADIFFSEETVPKAIGKEMEFCWFQMGMNGLCGPKLQ